jgi:uncharacterized protein (TIGR03083 family)
MAEGRMMTKADLLSEIERTWAALNAALGRLTDAQMTTPTDAHGWTVKDHIVHLTAWERSAVFFLEGKPRHSGLGIEEALYLQDSVDDINASIAQQGGSLSVGEALAQLRDVHEQLMALLQPLSDADLQKTYRHYLPDEPGEGEGPPAMDVVYTNSAHHYAEHLDWIEALVGKSYRAQ